MTDPDHETAKAAQVVQAHDAAKATRDATRTARRLARNEERRTRRRSRGPNTGSDLTPEVLGQVALAVLESEGLAQLSMRKVADRLGIRAPSLYWHVRNKEELLDLAIDALAGGFDATVPSGDWRERIHTMAHRYRAYLKAHSNAVGLLGRFAPGPRTARVLENVLRILREAGFDRGDAAHAMYLVFFVYVQGFVVQELVPLSAVEATGGTPGDGLRDLRERLAALPQDEFPVVRGSADLLTMPNLDNRFEFGLQRVLDGLQLRRDQTAVTPDFTSTPHDAGRCEP